MKRATPTSMGVFGAKSTASTSASMSAYVAGTSPACIGRKFFFASTPSVRSSTAMRCISSTGALFPML